MLVQKKESSHKARFSSKMIWLRMLSDEYIKCKLELIIG